MAVIAVVPALKANLIVIVVATWGRMTGSSSSKIRTLRLILGMRKRR